MEYGILEREDSDGGIITTRKVAHTIFPPTLPTDSDNKIYIEIYIDDETDAEIRDKLESVHRQIEATQIAMATISPNSKLGT